LASFFEWSSGEAKKVNIFVSCPSYQQEKEKEREEEADESAAFTSFIPLLFASAATARFSTLAVS
jgi:hypothetical protein